jgi:peroxiredoxin
MKKIILSLSLVLLLGVAVYTVSNYDGAGSSNIINSSAQKNTSNNPARQIKVAKPKVKAADFKLKDLNGKDVSLSDFKGKKVFLNFWASWCPPCKAEMPEMEKLYQETKDSDLVILSVDLSEDKATVQRFITDNKYNFPVLLDTDNAAASAYQVVSIPTSFFIDKEGNIVDKHIGSMKLEQMKSYINNIK